MRLPNFILALVLAWALAAEALPSHLRELEVRVWNAEDADVANLEREVVRLVQQEPSSAIAHQLLAHVLVRAYTKEPSELYLLKQASDLAQQAVDLQPKLDAGYVAMAEILDLMGNADRGLSILNNAEKSGVRLTWRYWFTRARLISDQANTSRVLQLFGKALTEPEAEPRIVVPYIVANLQSESAGEELIAKLQEWNQKFPTPLFALTMAITHSELGQKHRAQELYADIIKRYPDNKEAKINSGIVLYRDLKEPNKAVSLFENVLADDHAHLSPPIEAMVRAHLGAAYLNLKLYDKAHRSFLRAMDKDPQNLSILDFLSRNYRTAKAPERLVAILKELNGLIPGTGITHALLGETLSESLSRHRDALRAYGDAITLDPSRSDYYNGMGLTYYRMQEYRQALMLFKSATEVDPNDATARYNEACVLTLLGRKDEALTSLAEALSLDPRLSKTAFADPDFNPIRGHQRFIQLVSDPSSGGTPQFVPPLAPNAVEQLKNPEKSVGH